MEIAKAFELLSIPLFVAYYRRSYKRFLRLKALLDSGRYGQVSSVQYRLERPAPAPGATPAGWRQDASISGRDWYYTCHGPVFTFLIALRHRFNNPKTFQLHWLKYITIHCLRQVRP